MRRISFTDCPYCCSSKVYRSHCKRWGDFASLLFLLAPTRCHDCMRRHFRPIFIPAPRYIPPEPKKVVPIRADEDGWKFSA